MTTNHPPAETPDPAPAVPWARVDRFVGQFIHDIRNGLNGIELQLTLLGETSEDSAVREDVKGLRGGLVALSRELQAVRVAVGPVSPRPVPYPVGELLEDLRARLRQLPEIGGAVEGFAWVTDARAAEAEVAVDPELMFDALGRLFVNAVAFRETPTSPIGLNVSLDGGSRLLLQLRETKNSPPATADRLADWGNAPLVTTRRGAHAYGLGLFRARRIIEAHGGTLAAEYFPAEQRLETRLTLPLSSLNSSSTV